MPVPWSALTGASSPRWWAHRAGVQSDITDADLDELLTVADDDLKGRYPCVGSDPWGTLAEDELRAWAQAVGLQATLTDLSGASGASRTRVVTELKQGTVTKKYASSTESPEDVQKRLGRELGGALARIGCIKAARATKNTGKLMSTAGRRDSIGATQTVQGRLLGLDRERNLP